MGSSRSSRLGCWSSSLHSATRRRSPPERLSTRTSGGGQRSASIAWSRRLSRSHALAWSRSVCRSPISASSLSKSASGSAICLGDLVVAVELALDLADGLLDVLQDGLALAQRRLLLEHADRRVGVEDRVAVVGVVEPRHDLEQGGLAGAVGSDDADLGAVEEREGDVVEDDLVTVGLAHVAQREDVLSHAPEPTGRGTPLDNRRTPRTPAGPGPLPRSRPRLRRPRRRLRALGRSRAGSRISPVCVHPGHRHGGRVPRVTADGWSSRRPAWCRARCPGRGRGPPRSR